MTDAATQHILLHVTAEGKVFASGTDNIVNTIVGEALREDQDLHELQSHHSTDNVGYGIHKSWPLYNLLPCSPSYLYLLLVFQKLISVQLLQHC